MTQQKPKYPGLFLTFEGGEGAGKTSQINLLKDYFDKKNQDVLITREPGGTVEAEKIRDLLVQRDGGHWTPQAETLLFFAARHMHVSHLIEPALQNGEIVICDRFTDSTRAYQGAGHGLMPSFVDKLNHLIFENFDPDLTFILDIDPVVGLKRSKRNNTMSSNKKEQQEDRFENFDLSFHHQLRKGFLDIAKDNPQRCVIIDATLDLQTIHNQIIERLSKHV